MLWYKFLVPMPPLTPEPVLGYLAGLRRDPHERLAVIDREGRAEGLPLVYPDTGALLACAGTVVRRHAHSRDRYGDRLLNVVAGDGAAGRRR